MGPGGAILNFGKVLGTYLAAASSPSDFFLIGNGTTVNLAGATTIYALVNDSHYPNNLRSFDVNVRAVDNGVPEPVSWAMLLIGFGAIGGAMRPGRKGRATLTYA